MTKKSADQNRNGLANRVLIRRCKSQDEVSLAVELASRTLGPGSRYVFKKISNDFKIHPIKPEDVIIVFDKGRLVGTAAILEKELSLFGERIPASVVTCVCVESGYQGSGIGKGLMGYVVSDLEKRGATMSLLFARRAVDGFYEKFGYLGTGYFTELTPDTSCKNDINPKGIKLVPAAKNSEWRSYMGMYKETYRDVPFSFVRERNFWKNIEAWLKYRVTPEEFINVYHNGNLIGYFIDKDNRIIEAACLRRHMDVFNNSILAAKKEKKTELVMTFSCYHPCSLYFQKFNHTLKFRRAWNGGHMIRIINNKKFRELLADSICKKYSAVFKGKALSESVRGLRYHFPVSSKSIHARQALFDVAICDSNLITMEIAKVFRHCWSVIDEF